MVNMYPTLVLDDLHLLMSVYICLHFRSLSCLSQRGSFMILRGMIETFISKALHLELCNECYIMNQFSSTAAIWLCARHFSWDPRALKWFDQPCKICLRIASRYQLAPEFMAHCPSNCHCGSGTRPDTTTLASGVSGRLFWIKPIWQISGIRHDQRILSKRYSWMPRSG